MRLSTFICAALALSVAAASAQQVQPPERASQPATHAKTGIAFGSHNSNAPINVASDNFVGDLDTKVGTYVGNVIVTQADYKLRADKLRVEVAAGKPQRLVADGNVVFNSTSGTATGDNGVYDLGPRTVTLTGKVVLVKGKDVMRGSRLVVDMTTGLAHLTARGMPGGRVTGSFIPGPQSEVRTPPKSRESGDD